MTQELYRDPYGTIALDVDRQRLELIWLEASAGMNDDDFKAFLTRLAEYAESHRVPHVTVDVRAFRHQPGPAILGWRDTEIIPRYNSAGIVKFAFLLPEGAPEPPPAAEGPAQFPTGWFNTAAALDAWFGAP